MKTLLKGLVIVGLLLIVVIGAIAFIAFRNLDEIVRQGTEKALTYVLEVDCTVGGAEVNAGAGLIELQNITIPNPAGFDSDYAMKFGAIRVEADIASFRGDTPTINLIRITDSNMLMERKGGTTNFEALMASAQRFSSEDTEETAEEVPPPAEEEAGKSVVIKKLIVEGTQVGVRLPAISQDLSVQIPDIEQEDIGGDEGESVSPAEAVGEFMALILDSITNAGAGILPDDLLNNLQGTLSSLPADLRGQLDGLTTNAGEFIGNNREAADQAIEDARGEVDAAVEGAKKQAEDAANELREGIGGLLGRQRNEE